MTEFVFFGGKGGVGKTTVSAAYGLKCAGEGLRTLLVSTDPAHSTSDVFDQGFDDDPTPVEGHENLHAMEIDPEEEVDRHMTDIRRRMSDQVSPAVVNEIDRQIELAHRTPGAYEAALFDRFIKVMREARPSGGPRDERAAGAASREGERREPSDRASGDAASREDDEFDCVIFDTSPTGGTLRLLSLPEFLGEWLDRLVEKRAKSIDLFEKAAIGGREARRRAEEDPIIEHLRQRKEKFEFAGEVLRERASFYLVVNPDELSVRETNRSIDQMHEAGLSVAGLVVNRVTPEPDADEDGQGARYLRDRVATERERIRQVRETLAPPVVAIIETRVREVKGDLLAEIADEVDIAVVPESTA